MKKYHFLIKSFLLVIFLVGAAAAPAFAKPNEWLRKIKRIELLKTTRAEIEKMFDNPQVVEIEDLAVDYKNGWGKLIKYETKYGKLEVWYGAGKCSESKGKPYAYDIAADAAAMVTFFPNEIVLENQTVYDLSKFKTDSGSETDKTYSLETEKLKITIEVENFQVASIEYDVSEKYKTRLECKNVTVKEPVWFEKLRKLELFGSTRNDLEILFENPRIIDIEDDSKNGGNIEIEYETIYGALEVEYSSGKCSERQSKYGYDAERNTILELEFEPTEQPDPTEFNYDLRTFESDGSSCMPGLTTRRNDLLGIGFSLIDSKISRVEFFPSEKQEELDCEKVFNSQK